MVLPPQLWVKKGIQLVLWVGAFYFTARVSVPRLLLHGPHGLVCGLVLAVTAAVLILGRLGPRPRFCTCPTLLHNAFHAAREAAEGGGGPGRGLRLGGRGPSRAAPATASTW